MYFRARYIIRNFDFQGATISVSDQTKRIEVQIAKRSADETHPPLEPYQGVATATCQRDIPASVHNEAESSGKLSVNADGVIQVQQDLLGIVLRTLRLARWRVNCPKSGHNPLQYAAGFDWSLDGTVWNPVSDNIVGLKIELSGGSFPWLNEDADFVRTEILGELDEPFAHQLLREAVANRKDNPRSSLVLAVAAAEIGFKQFASKAFPDTDWILDKLPSPSLDTMLSVFPWSKLGLEINRKVPSVPSSIKGGLRKAVELRNKVVHVGVGKLEIEKVDSALTSVRDLLYFLDALRGQEWASKHISTDALKSFSS